jgi:Lipase (class 3)
VVSPIVLQVMTEMITKYPFASILVTGHSLGGALAILSALDLRYNLPLEDEIMIYTFGQPRIANDRFANIIQRQFQDSYFRFVNYDDMVAHLPSRNTVSFSRSYPFFQKHASYKHAGNEFWYKSKNGRINYTKLCMFNPDEDENQDCSSSLLWQASIANHINYLNLEVSAYCTVRQPVNT